MVDPITTGAVIASGWAGKKLLGPTLDVISEDLRGLYEAWRSRIINRAVEKVENLDDGKCANLRVAKDVLWNGALSDNVVSVEYYAGLLAASRSVDGMDDEAIPFVDAVNSLASRQLKLHYDIYRSLERILEQAHTNGEKFDLYEIHRDFDVFVSGHAPDTIGLDLQVLLRNSLITQYSTGSKIVTWRGHDSILFFYKIRPSLFGISLYAAAHNQLEWWRAFGLRPFGEFGNVKPPEIYGRTLEELLDRRK